MKLHLPLKLRNAVLSLVCSAVTLTAVSLPVSMAAPVVLDGKVEQMVNATNGVTSGAEYELINGVRYILESTRTDGMFVADGNNVGTLWLGNGTIVFEDVDASPVYFNNGASTTLGTGGYTIRVMDDAARIRVGSNQFLTIAELSGVAGSQSTEAAYHDVTIQGNARGILVNKASALKNLDLTGGIVTLGNAADSMSGAVHGRLNVGGKSHVTLASDNILAADARELVVSSDLALGATTQMLHDGMAIELKDGIVSGESGQGAGFVLSGGADISLGYSGKSNSVSADIAVSDGATLSINNLGSGTFTENALLLSGVLSGEGKLNIGSGMQDGVGMVTLAGDNSGYTGHVTLSEGSVLSLNHAKALGGAASLTMNAGSYLYVNTADASSVHVQNLTLDSGATLALQNVSSSYEPNAELAALSVDSVTFANSGQVDKPVYYVMFGEELQTMRTFSLICSKSEMAPSGLAQVDVRVKAADGKLTQLAVDDYKLGVYKLGSEENVFYLQTRFGNVWDGAESDNWIGNNWEGSAYNAEKFNYALFVNKGGGDSTVDLKGETVNPAKIYVDNSPAEQGVGLTNYVITDGFIGAGVEIHKQGDSYGSNTVGTVEFRGVQGGSSGNALGWVTVSGGEMKLTDYSTFYFDGSKMVQVDADSALTIDTTSELIARNGNTISGVSGHPVTNGLPAYLSGLKISDDTILGGISAGYDTVVQNASISGFTIKDVKLAGAGTIHNGRLENVVLAENADWYLTGNIAISDTLKVDGNGSEVYIDFAFEKCSLDFGGVEYTRDGDVYTFDVIQGVKHVYGFSSGILSYNGVKLRDLEAAGVGVDALGFGDNIGRVKLDMRETGMKIVSWDAAWAASGVGAQPTFAKTFSTGGSTAFVGDDNYKSFISTEEKPVTVVSVESTAKGEVLAGGTVGYKGDIWITDDGSTYTTKVAALYRTTEELTGDSHLQIAGGSGADVYGSSVGADRMNKANHTGDTYVTIKGGSYTNVYGGGSNVNHTGDTRVYVYDGASVTNVYGGSAGTSTDNGLAELFLEGGTITNVYGAGSNTSEFTGRTFTEDTVLNGVTIKAGDKVSSLIHLSADVRGLSLLDGDAYGDLTGVYGATADKNHPNGKHILHFTDSAYYDLSYTNGGVHNAAGVTIRDFTDIVLADDAYVKANHLYTISSTDPSFENGEVVTISGKGTVELVGQLKNNVENEDEIDSAFRTIYLKDNARLFLNTEYLGKWASSSITPFQIVHVSDGTTLETTGNPTDRRGSNVHLHAYLEGDGVDGKGAWYKGLAAKDDDGAHTEMSHITLTNDASAGGEGTMYMNAFGYTNSVLDLTNGTIVTEPKDVTSPSSPSQFVSVTSGGANYTFTKVGTSMLGLKNTHIEGGTLNILEGSVNVTAIEDNDALEPYCSATKTDVVLGKMGTLQLDYMTNNGYNQFNVASLSGEGSVELQENGSLNLLVQQSAFYSEFLNDESISYYNESGYSYAMFSGAITSEVGGLVSKAGVGTQYFSGSESTYGGEATGYTGTWITRGTLYLLGTSTASVFEQGNTVVEKGVAGVGTIYWYEGAKTPEGGALYLGDGVRIYNSGSVTLGTTALDGEEQVIDMIIGVEAAPNGETLGGANKDKYLVLQEDPQTGMFTKSTVTLAGVEYVQINTANLSSISIDAMYMDGTAYVAGSEIDRNKMLLIENSVWDDGRLTATVKGLNSAGYNEATYSGVLSDGDVTNGSLKGKLVKVGEGTLTIDQKNDYTGGTDVKEGSLKLIGWATVGANEADNRVNMLQEDGASILLAYNNAYDNEQRSIVNDILIKGLGDRRWDDKQTEGTDGETAALISDVGTGVDFLLDGAITGAGNLLHSGEGTLTLNGESDYTMGTIITRSMVTVTSATGLGATAQGQDAALKLYEGATLRLTVGGENPDTGAALEQRGVTNRIDHEVTTGDAKLDVGIKQWMVTELAAVKSDTYSGNDIQGTVEISGSGSVERVMAMTGSGYEAEKTQLSHYNGTLVFADEAATTDSAGILTGKGTIAVSDIDTEGENDAQGTAYAYFSKMDGYTGSVVVEGTGAQLEVGEVSGVRGKWVGEYIDSKNAYIVNGGVTDSVGQVSVSGQGAEFTASSADIFVTVGSSLSLTSNGHAESGGVGSVASVTANNVIIETGATICVNQSATDFQYQLKELEAAAVLKPTDIANNAVLNGYGYTRGENLGFEGASGYEFAYDKNIAVNQAAVGAVCRGDSAGGRLGFQGGATYEATKGNANLCKGLLTLDVYDGRLIKLDFVPDKDLYTIASANEDKRVQLVLFSGVDSVHFCSMEFYSKFTTSGGNVYYTMASNYFENEYIELYNPYLVFDASAGIVYMDFMVPEPTTTTLGILALAALAARRRRR